jgi:hypothetical protein
MVDPEFEGFLHLNRFGTGLLGLFSNRLWHDFALLEFLYLPFLLDCRSR